MIQPKSNIKYIFVDGNWNWVKHHVYNFDKECAQYVICDVPDTLLIIVVVHGVVW